MIFKSRYNTMQISKKIVIRYQLIGIQGNALSHFMFQQCNTPIRSNGPEEQRHLTKHSTYIYRKQSLEKTILGPFFIFIDFHEDYS